MNTHTAAHRPFLPSDRVKARDSLVRAAAAHFIAEARGAGTSPDAIVAKMFGNDAVAQILTRAAVGPASTTGSGWADTLATTAIADFVSSLGPVSAGATLFGMGMRVEFAGRGTINVPVVVPSTATAGRWVVEGEPSPVLRLSTSAASLTPRKLMAITVHSVELAKATGNTVEAVIRTGLREATALALDAALFDATAGDTSRPAGLLNGVSALTATAGGGIEALIADIENLVAAVAPVAGSQIVFVANPVDAVKIALRVPQPLGYPVLTSSALTTGTIIAVAVNAVVSGFGVDPLFETSDQATLHMEDTSPLQIGTEGTPATVAAPVQSLWQQGLVGLRMILPASWALRSSGAIAWVEGATW